jgi:hypothetical protein
MLAVLAAGITNAHGHVHLCFDGEKPPAAVYLADSGDDLHEPDSTTCSGDVDVDLQTHSLAKTVKHDLSAIEAPVLWTLAVHAPTASVLPAFAPAPPFRVPLYSHPPLRAPPR